MDVRNVINLKPALIVIIALAVAARGPFNSANAANASPSANPFQQALAFARRMRFSPGALMRALAVLAVAPLLTTACVGNPFAPKDTAAQQRHDAEQMELKWAQCMRDHGVDVPDPGTNGAVQIGGQAQDQQQVQDAMNACKQYQPTGGNGPGKVDQKALDQLTKFAQCMRDHGIPMQDPKASGGGIQMGSGGEGSVDKDSDQFQQAQQACQHLMPSQIQQKTGSSSGP